MQIFNQIYNKSDASFQQICEINANSEVGFGPPAMPALAEGG